MALNIDSLNLLTETLPIRLLHLVESGIVKYMLGEHLPQAEICPQNLGGTERQLRNGDLLMTYQIMAAGFGTGGIIFFTEVKLEMLSDRVSVKFWKFCRFYSDAFLSVRKITV